MSLSTSGCPGSLADAANLENLRELLLNDNRQISTPGIRALADSANFANLRLLDLSGNGLNESAIKVLINGESLKLLDAVSLQGNNIGDSGVKALAEGALGPDPQGHRREFLQLVDRAHDLSTARG